MNDTIIDEVAAGVRQWSTALTTALTQAGFSCEWESQQNATARLGTLTAREPSNKDVSYRIEFERKFIVRKNVRTFVCGVSVYHPSRAAHVHVTNFSDEAVAKIANYAKVSIGERITSRRTEAERAVRSKQGWNIYHAGTEDFTLPDWATVRPNTASDADVGTFRLWFNAQQADWPCNRLTLDQVKAVIEAVRTSTLHPLSERDAWQPASVPVPPELQSTPLKIKMLLLAIPGRDAAVRGWFMGGLVNEFYMEGSPSQWHPTHWMPMPAVPTTSSK